MRVWSTHHTPVARDSSLVTSAVPIGTDSSLASNLTDGTAPSVFGQTAYNFLYATPHPYRDTANLKSSYDPTPHWRHLVNDYLDKEATAIVATFEHDVNAIETKLLAVLDFPRPYLIIPVHRAFGRDALNRELMVIARRPMPLPTDSFLTTDEGEMLLPIDIIDRLELSLRNVIHIFAESDQLRSIRPAGILRSLAESPINSAEPLGPLSAPIAGRTGKSDDERRRKWAGGAGRDRR